MSTHVEIYATKNPIALWFQCNVHSTERYIPCLVLKASEKCLRFKSVLYFNASIPLYRTVLGYTYFNS